MLSFGSILEYICCLIELKFCEISRDSFLNRYWNFQFSVLKNKKVSLLKKKFFLSVVNIKTIPTSEGFDSIDRENTLKSNAKYFLIFSIFPWDERMSSSIQYSCIGYFLLQQYRICSVNRLGWEVMRGQFTYIVKSRLPPFGFKKLVLKIEISGF